MIYNPWLFKKKMYIWIYKIYVTNKMPLLPVVFMNSSSSFIWKGYSKSKRYHHSKKIVILC